MSQQQQTILAAITEIHRATYAPAKTISLAQRIYMSQEQTRRYLRALEASGVVRRVGQRGGWLPVAVAA